MVILTNGDFINHSVEERKQINQQLFSKESRSSDYLLLLYNCELNITALQVVLGLNTFKSLTR